MNKEEQIAIIMRELGWSKNQDTSPLTWYKDGRGIQDNEADAMTQDLNVLAELLSVKFPRYQLKLEPDRAVLYPDWFTDKFFECGHDVSLKTAQAARAATAEALKVEERK